MQLFNVGVTVIVAITGDDPAFNTVKAEISLEPEPTSPIEGVEFVQL